MCFLHPYSEQWYTECCLRPVAFNKDGSLNKGLTENPYPTWQKLEEMVEKGKIRNIGVSKYVTPSGTNNKPY